MTAERHHTRLISLGAMSDPIERFRYVCSCGKYRARVFAGGSYSRSERARRAAKQHEKRFNDPNIACQRCGEPVDLWKCISCGDVLCVTDIPVHIEEEHA